MTYATIATMAVDNSLFNRLVAAAAEENKPKPYESWVAERRWDIVTAPGWAAAWESALAAGVADPGIRSDVITDGMILAVVQPME